MWSDALRWPRLVGVLFLLMLLGGGYAWRAVNAPIGWRLCIAAPTQHDGDALLFPLYTVSAIEGPRRYRLSKEIRAIPVEGDTAGLHVGQTVSVRATFRAADQVAVETARERHRLRAAKQALGVLGMVLCLVSAPWTFAWGPLGLVVRRG